MEINKKWTNGGETGDACAREQRVEHELELSTGFVVGFCYHTAADLRVCSHT